MAGKGSFNLSFNSVIWIILVSGIAYQLTFTWIPLWRKATLLRGTDVSKIQIEDKRGRLVDLSEFKGKTLILNFWASWCIPCRLELPLLNSIYPQLSEMDKQLIGINQSESWKKIDKFRESTAISFPVFKDKGELSRVLNIQMIPAIVVINKESKVDSITYGFRPWVQAYLLWWI